MCKCDLVSDLKKKIMDEVKAILSEKKQGNWSFKVTSYFIVESCEYNEVCPR